MSLEKEFLDYIDSGRGETPRNRVFESLITKGIEIERNTSCTQEQR
jgi:hypothetical protein